MVKARIEKYLKDTNAKKDETLSLLASNGNAFSRERYRVLQETGLTGSANFAKEEELKKSIDKHAVILEENQFINGIKNEFDDVEVIEFSALVSFCKEFNLLFGKANLFKGIIPSDILDEMLTFNFNRIKNSRRITTTDTITAHADTKDEAEPTIYIASIPSNFNGNKAVISNCEIIESNAHSKLTNLVNHSYKDTLILSPVRYSGKIYFLIIKNY